MGESFISCGSHRITHHFPTHRASQVVLSQVFFLYVNLTKTKLQLFFTHSHDCPYLLCSYPKSIQLPSDTFIINIRNLNQFFCLWTNQIAVFDDGFSTTNLFPTILNHKTQYSKIFSFVLINLHFTFISNWGCFNRVPYSRVPLFSNSLKKNPTVTQQRFPSFPSFFF